MNEEKHILTENQKILNINIVECYKEWYNGTYKTPKNDYEKNLILLSALIYTDKVDEFNQIIRELSANREIKSVIKEVATRMTEDEILTVRYVDFLEENKKINQSIINAEKKKERKIGHTEGRKEGRKEKEREMILKMYKDNVDINIISKYVDIPIENVKEIIDSSEK